jgi:hypothetical protein
MEVMFTEMLSQIHRDRQGWLDFGAVTEPDADWLALTVAQRSAWNQERVAEWLYDNYVSGYVPPPDLDDDARKHIYNTRVMGMDQAFAVNLHRHNCGTGYWDPDWEVLGTADDGRLILKKQHLKVYADRERYLPPDWDGGVNDCVALKLPKNLVVGDRYVAVGNGGKPSGRGVQLLFNFAANDVAMIMARMTRDLNAADRPFTFAVAEDPLDYPCWDAGILQINQADEVAVLGWVETWAKEWGTVLYPDTARFAQQLFPGIGRVESSETIPDLMQHCCQIVAAAIVAAPIAKPDRTLSVIKKHFQQAGLNWQRPYLLPI